MDTRLTRRSLCGAALATSATLTSGGLVGT